MFGMGEPLAPSPTQISITTHQPFEIRVVYKTTTRIGRAVLWNASLLPSRVGTHQPTTIDVQAILC
jgi:hypothetical protein